MLSESAWLFVQVAFPILLVVIVACVALRRRRLTPREKTERHEAIQELYEDTPQQRAARERAEEPQFEPRRRFNG
jgi:hypothetical protein